MNKTLKLFTTIGSQNFRNTTFLINKQSNTSLSLLSTNSRSFHSSNKSLFFFENVFGKIKNVITGGDKEKNKKEYPINEKEFENKTNLNLQEQQKEEEIKKSKELTPEEKVKREKENEEYQKLLLSGAKYDFIIFKEYIQQYASQITDKDKKDEIALFCKIIDVMTPQERANPYVFHKNAFKIRARVIKDSGTSMQVFASLINTFNSAKQLHDVLGSFKRQGKDVPSSANELPNFLKSNAVEIKKELDRIKKEETRRL